jgi:hypothetical protein
LKITDAEAIRNREKAFIDSFVSGIDWAAVRTILGNKYGLNFSEEGEYRGGDMIARNGGVVYRLDFDLRVKLSLLLDRAGNCLNLTDDAAPESRADSGADEIAPLLRGAESSLPSADPGKKTRENMSEMASQLAEMISEINTD